MVTNYSVNIFFCKKNNINNHAKKCVEINQKNAEKKGTMLFQSHFLR